MNSHERVELEIEVKFSFYVLLTLLTWLQVHTGNYAKIQSVRVHLYISSFHSSSSVRDLKMSVISDKVEKLTLPPLLLSPVCIYKVSMIVT